MSTSNTAVESEIVRLLATETRASVLSRLLFAEDGLFSRLASSREDRRRLVRTELFRSATRRVLDLQRAEQPVPFTSAQTIASRH